MKFCVYLFFCSSFFAVLWTMAHIIKWLNRNICLNLIFIIVTLCFQLYLSTACNEHYPIRQYHSFSFMFWWIVKTKITCFGDKWPKLTRCHRKRKPDLLAQVVEQVYNVQKHCSLQWTHGSIPGLRLFAVCCSPSLILFPVTCSTNLYNKYIKEVKLAVPEIKVFYVKITCFAVHLRFNNTLLLCQWLLCQ